MNHQITAEVPDVIPERYDPFNRLYRTKRIAARDALQSGVQRFKADKSQRRGYIFFGDRIAREADHLIQSRFGVAHRAFAGAGYTGERRIADVDAECVGDVTQLFSYAFWRDCPKFIDLAPRQNRLRHLMHLGSRHYKKDVRRGFFYRLQKSVKRLGRKLMDLINDKYLVSIPGGSNRDGIYYRRAN